jgi:hypothetical protein
MNVGSHYRLAPPQDGAQELVALARSVKTLPSPHREKFEPLILRAMESLGRRRRILRMVQEALSQLQLEMKYLVFDLEATRRERDEAVRARLDQDETEGLGDWSE